MTSLDQEIKQTRPFKSEVEKCIVNIIYTNNCISIFQNKIVKEYGISIEQYNVLRILNGRRGEPITIGGIMERMLDKMSNASRLVDKLYVKGLVERKQKEGNRRACDVLITKKGKEIMESVKEKMDRERHQIFNMENSELVQLNELLDKFRSGLSDLK